MGRRWTEYEDTWLGQVWPVTMVSTKAIAHALKRTIPAIRQRAAKLEIRRPWYGSPEHNEQLKRLHETWTNSPENLEHLKKVGKKGLKKIQETWNGSPRNLKVLKRARKKTWIGSPENLEQLKQARRKSRLDNSSKLELEVKVILDKGGINYLQHEPAGTGGKFHPDFFLPDYNTIIEVDGCYWHECEECGWKLPPGQRNGTNGRAWTKVRNAYFQKCGYTLIIVPEHEKKNGYSTLINFLEGLHGMVYGGGW